MPSRIGLTMMTLGAAAQLAILIPGAPPAAAQRYEDRHGRHDAGWNDDRRPGARDRYRRERERRRRNDAKTDGVVAGVVGTALLAGIIAAATSGKKDRGDDDRARYCRDRYGNYDRESDGYRASDGRLYPCQ